MENKKNWNLYLLFSLLFFAINAFLTYLLLHIPFGFVFKLFFYLTIIGFFLILGLLCKRLLIAAKRWINYMGYLLTVLSVVLLIAINILIIDYRIILNLGSIPKPDKEEWIEDLDYLAEQMESIHPDLYSLIPEDEFKMKVGILKDKIPGLEDEKMFAEFAKIIALPNDAHTFPNVFSLNLDLHVFPLQTYFFDDGVYITNTGREHKDLIGSRIIKIDEIPIDVIVERMNKYLSAENEYGHKSRSTFLIADWLFNEGLITESKKATFTLKNEYNEVKLVALKPIHYLPYFYWAMVRPVKKEISPVITNDRKFNYWFEYSPETRNIYCQYNRVRNADNESMVAFTLRLEEFIKQTNPNKLIIDIRNNDGGNGSLNVPFVEMIKKNEIINQKGKLFVLIGRKTFSAAVMFASMIQNNTEAIFVGEPTAQGPIFYSQPINVTLPNSGLQFLISSKLTQSSLAIDKSKWIEPQIAVNYTYNDFVNGFDPEIEAVMNYVPKNGHPYNYMDKHLGTYRYSSFQLLLIRKKDDQLFFEINDFIDSSCKRVYSSLYPVSEFEYTTDIQNVRLSFERPGNTDSVKLLWGNEYQMAYRVQDDYKLPMEYIQLGDLDKGIELIIANKENLIAGFFDLETSINVLGYKYLNEKKFIDAIKIFQLNVTLYPNGFNTYDSLGEAYMENGQFDLAVENYKKSLELNPNNTNAAKMIKKISKIQKIVP